MPVSRTSPKTVKEVAHPAQLPAVRLQKIAAMSPLPHRLATRSCLQKKARGLLRPSSLLHLEKHRAEESSQLSLWSIISAGRYPPGKRPCRRRTETRLVQSE